MSAKTKEIQGLKSMVDANKYNQQEERVKAIENALNQIFSSREGTACVNFEEFYARSDQLIYMVRLPNMFTKY